MQIELPWRQAHVWDWKRFESSVTLSGGEAVGKQAPSGLSGGRSCRKLLAERAIDNHHQNYSWAYGLTQASHLQADLPPIQNVICTGVFYCTIG